jgi:hypothetical protein
MEIHSPGSGLGSGTQRNCAKVKPSVYMCMYVSLCRLNISGRGGGLEQGHRSGGRHTHCLGNAESEVRGPGGGGVDLRAGSGLWAGLRGC